MTAERETATLAGGCFWCTEALFVRLAGVESAVPGYAGGHVVEPTYSQVCAGRTGHAEAVQIVFDPRVIAFETLLDVFWHTHNPTTLNQQGADIGPQYRSVIYYHSPQQQEIAERSRAALTRSGEFTRPIVTAIEPFSNFYEAEDYHKNFFENHGSEGYCSTDIAPKVAKLVKNYESLLKREYAH